MARLPRGRTLPVERSELPKAGNNWDLRCPWITDPRECDWIVREGKAKLPTGPFGRVIPDNFGSDLEIMFIHAIKERELCIYRQMYREFQFAPQWKRTAFDFAWPCVKVAVEIEGATFAAKSRHGFGMGAENDMLKYNEAQMLGWVILRAGTKRVESFLPSFVDDVVRTIRFRGF